MLWWILWGCEQCPSFCFPQQRHHDFLAITKHLSWLKNETSQAWWDHIAEKKHSFFVALGFQACAWLAVYHSQMGAHTVTPHRRKCVLRHKANNWIHLFSLPAFLFLFRPFHLVSSSADFQVPWIAVFFPKPKCRFWAEIVPCSTFQCHRFCNLSTLLRLH